MTRAAARGRALNAQLALLDPATREPVADPLGHLLAGAEGGLSGHCELLVRPDATTLPIDYTISPLHGASRATAGLVLTLRDASRLHARIEQLVEAARHDEHTQLLRRGELERRLARLLENIADGDCHALLFMDLDRFKTINDQAGHVTGDIVLREVAELFRAQVRERDTLARLGGDEFGLLLEHCPLELAEERARALQTAVASHVVDAENRRFSLDVSIGIAAIRRGGRDVYAVIGAADAACYAAKRQPGGGRIATTVLD
jgi:diguanylate cyclase (GGDEF)-like protein